MVYYGNDTLRLHSEPLYALAKVEDTVYSIMDAPWGYALRILPEIKGSVVVVIGVFSAPYLHDLIELKPQIIMARPVGPDEVVNALRRAGAGESFYDGPPYEEIAHLLGVSARTVENRVVALKEKTGLRNRAELALYYLGMLPSQWGSSS